VIDRSEFLQPFSALLPNSEETLLLCAGLWSGDRARVAWREWQEKTQTPFIGRNPAIQKLRLLLAQAHQRNNFAMGKPSQTLLRLSYFKEVLRREIYRRICSDALKTFDRSGIAFTVLKGAALAETIYAPALRHCHDIDVLLRIEDFERAAALVEPLRFTRSIQPRFDERSMRLEHKSKLPLELHSEIFLDRDANVIANEMLQRRRSATIGGTTADILGNEDNLLHVCAHAFSSQTRQSLRWVSDAWQIITKCHDLDWRLLLNTALRGRLVLPLAVILLYLANRLDAPVPAEFLRTLENAAAD
jgi:hypothetical protein